MPANEPSGEAATERSHRLTRLKKAGKVYGLVSDILTPQRLGLLAAVAVLLVSPIVKRWMHLDTLTDDEPEPEAADVQPERRPA